MLDYQPLLMPFSLGEAHRAGETQARKSRVVMSAVRARKVVLEL